MKLRYYIVRPGSVPGRVIFFVGKMNMALIRKVTLKNDLWNGEGQEVFSDPQTDWGCCWHAGVNQIIWLNSFKRNDPHDIGMLVHEVNHAVFNRAGHLGFTLSPDSDEHYCYEAEYLAGAFINALQKKFFKEAK